MKQEPFLGTFTKQPKWTNSYMMSVCMEQLCSHWADVHEI